MATNPQETSIDERAYKKAFYRIVPFLFVCYVFAYMDRINIGFAKLQMSQTLGLSDAAFGLAAGIFFIGYVPFEVPSNLLLARTGARRTFGRILVLWGLVSIGTAFVRGAGALQTMRFFLGVFEAGLAPGILFYLTLWFGQKRLGRVLAVFMSSAALAGVIGSPLSTFIMTQMNGKAGLFGWQWMFVLEGTPPVLLGLIAYALLSDRPNDANWLTKEEKNAIIGSLEPISDPIHRTAVSAFRDPIVYAMSICYFGIICGLYAIAFWLPTVISAAGAGTIQSVGWYGAVPYLVAVVFMYGLGRLSDASGERVYYSAVPAILAAVSLALSIWLHGSFSLSMILISLATGCIYGSYGVFWTIPSEYFGSRAAPAGLALINTIGLLGGFASPACIGWVKSLTHSLDAPLLLLACVVLVSALGLLALRTRLNMTENSHQEMARLESR
jgi:sugar phosphate permease